MRLARPTNDLAGITRMYCEGLGLEVLGSFEDHAGIDGVMLGQPSGGLHLEFTYEHDAAKVPPPHPDQLLVFYQADGDLWRTACERMTQAGFQTVRAHNPYWNQHGVCFEDLDGGRLVWCQRHWPS